LPSDGIESVRWAADYLEGARKYGREPDPDYLRVESQLRIALARLLTVQWKHEEVLRLARQASDLAAQVGETQLEMQALTLLGWALEGQGDYPQAMVNLQRALAYYRQHGNLEMQARTLMRTGTIFWRQAETLQALANYQEAFDLFRVLNNPAGMAGSLTGLGNVYSQQWQFSQALDCYRQAYDLDRAADRKAGMVTHLGNMGVIYGSIGDYPQALSAYQEALQIEEELGNRGVPICGSATWPRCIGSWKTLIKLARPCSRRLQPCGQMVTSRTWRAL
jgi:tetratricopeptide (TPR) repeat protein